MDEVEAKTKTRQAEEKMKAEQVERRKRDWKNLRRETRSLRDRGGSLDREEREAIDKIQTTDELLSDGTLKLQTALSSGSMVLTQAAKVACVMIKTAKSNQAKMER